MHACLFQQLSASTWGGRRRAYLGGIFRVRSRCLLLLKTIIVVGDDAAYFVPSATVLPSSIPAQKRNLSLATGTLSLNSSVESRHMDRRALHLPRAWRDASVRSLNHVVFVACTIAASIPIGSPLLCVLVQSVSSFSVHFGR